MYKKIVYAAASAASALALFVQPVAAQHSWNGLHWARTSNPFTLKIGDNVSGTWDGHLATSSGDWTDSAVLDTVIVPGSVNPKRCPGKSGMVQVCNASYGKNGWLGIASVWTSGGHISQATVKLNDTYFNTAQYNTPAWRNLVMCQEIGHTLGLDHQDEDHGNTNLDTCMDYSSNPESNQHPNAHDYEQLEAIYAHLDTTNSVSTASNGVSAQVRAEEPGEWGQLVKNRGQRAVYVRDLGHGRQIVTFVIYA